MGFLAKASALFFGLRVSTSYHQALQVSDDDHTALMAARRDIRAVIKQAGKSIQVRDEYWESSFASKSATSRPVIEPKFFTQGSVAYDLLVDPCQTPPQQIDLDDGMYVRVDYLQNGQPALVARQLFAMVEAALAPLCIVRGWTLNPAPVKDTCVRVQISTTSHVDIPIYSAPPETTEIMASESYAADSLQKSMVTARAGRTYEKLPPDKIMLAQRDGTWQPSDPLRLHEWVELCVERYGVGFRRACRYFKGWRDHTWDNCCLSSIAVMAAVAEAFRQMGSGFRDQDDDRLVYEIAQRLPDILQGELLNPAYPGERVVLNDWADDDRCGVVDAAKALAATMEAALTRSGDATAVVDHLRSAFGDRIPYRPDAVQIVLTAAPAIRAERAATVPSPKITPSTSG